MASHIPCSVLLLPVLLLPLGSLPRTAAATDVPVAGRNIVLKAAGKAKTRKLVVVLEDGAIAAPFPDPTLGARLIVSGGAATGQCYAEIDLDPAGWQPRGGSGAVTGWKYRPSGTPPGGVRKIVVRPGRITIRARGGDWPCDLGADLERTPVAVRLVVDDVRYCAAFGGAIKRNQAGRFLAKNAAAPSVCAEKDDVTAVNLNLLHGIFCGHQGCRQSDRIDLLFDWLELSSCPDVVTLQEITSPMGPAVQARLATHCPFTYEMVHGVANLVDDAITLSRFPVVHSEVTDLHPGFRNVLYTRIDHPTGPLDVFTTHLASSADGATSPCGATCPAECVAAGATTIRECQSVQVAELVETKHDVPTPALLTGDFNSEPGSFEILQLTGRGWIDTYTQAGATCDPVTGLGCSSARDSSLADLESPAILIAERIDYIFLIPPASATCSVDSPFDDDADGIATTMWADQPNPFAACGPLPDAICWPSDHNGNQLDLACS